MERFRNKVLLITGAASGIGRATAQRVAAEGASVLCVDIQAEALAESAREADSAGNGKIASRVCDVGSADAIRETVAHCMEAFGRLDSLCNVAGVLHTQNSLELSLEDWNRVVNINLTGTFLMCQAAIPHLLESHGNIVNTSSTSALAGLPWGAAYSASKGGVLALTRTLAVEYGKRGLRVNAVCPGSITTPMTEATRLPEDADMKLVRRLMPLDQFRGPETVAGAIAFLASDDAAHVNGEHVRVDGATLS